MDKNCRISSRPLLERMTSWKQLSVGNIRMEYCYLRMQLINCLRKGQTPKKCQLLCNCSSIKDACPLVALTAPQQNNGSYSLFSVFLWPCILHVCPRKCLHYKCDMLAYNDAHHSIWSTSSLNSAAAFHMKPRPESKHFCKQLVILVEPSAPHIGLFFIFTSRQFT